MGDQSSGKSSVLEALSGIPFPRGHGLVTKCATELRMKRAKNKTEWSAKLSLTWDREQPEECREPVTSPEAIGSKIAELTEILLQARGNGATIEPEHSIRVELTSPDVPDLTVIDLPGIVRTATAGQTNTIVSEVNDLLKRYLQLARTVVLAVIPANVDIATVDILSKANEVDPEGCRTIGVLTKPDLVDKGGEGRIVDVVLGNLKPLRLGYIMVKNRSQEDINSGVCPTLVEAKSAEQKYFLAHCQFRDLHSSGHCGVDSLAAKLTSVLVQRIHDLLPDIHKEVQAKLNDVRESLDACAKPPPSTPDECCVAFTTYLRNVADSIRDAVEGNYNSPVFIQHDYTIRSIARVRNGPFTSLQTNIKQLKPSHEVSGPWSTVVLQQRRREMRGRELPGFLRHDVFKLLVNEYVQDWRAPIVSTINEIGNILTETFSIVVEHHIPLSQFPKLHNEVAKALSSILEDRLKAAKGPNGPESLFQDELEPMTLNDSFSDIFNKIKMEEFEMAVNAAPTSDNHYQQQSQVALLTSKLRTWYKEIHMIGNDSHEQHEAENLQAILTAYWEISSNRFIDNACARLDTVILRGLDQDLFRCPLMAKLIGKGEDLTDFFQEGIKTRDRREGLKQREAILQRALDIISDRNAT